jgi:hypothetical protein
MDEKNGHRPAGPVLTVDAQIPKAKKTQNNYILGYCVPDKEKDVPDASQSWGR